MTNTKKNHSNENKKFDSINRLNRSEVSNTKIKSEIQNLIKLISQKIKDPKMSKKASILIKELLKKKKQSK